LADVLLELMLFGGGMQNPVGKHGGAELPTDAFVMFLTTAFVLVAAAAKAGPVDA
jgi:hypothetical protein